MNSPLPPDPYKALGVSKDAKLPDIRSAHRKLVLKCHPDKVQDAALKAVKQDEFQKVQQAYEILSDDSKRQQYDDQVKLFELRKEMGRGNPTPRSNPFEYEVKTAEPRANSYARAAPKVYTFPTSVPRSHEDLYEEPIRHTPKKSSSYESATDRDRKRPSAREDPRAREAALRKLAEEERVREERIQDRLREERLQAERMREREKRERSHSKKEKSRDKKVHKEEKTRARQPYFEEESSEDEAYMRSKAAKKEEKRRMEEETRIRQEQQAAAAEAARVQARAQAPRPPTIKEAPMDPKWSDHRDFAGAYMQAARRKVAPEPEDHHARPAGLRRAETSFVPPSPYQVRYTTAAPQYSDDDTPRRSSGLKESRRSSDTPPSKREKSRRRSPEHPRDPYINIVEPLSPSLPPKKPTLKTYSSEPPMPPLRKEPSRARTQDDYSRKDAAPPPMPRSQTFNGETRGREHGSSRSRKEYASAESEDEIPMYSPRLSHSPHRAEPTVYRVSDSRAHPVPSSRSHRSDLHGLNEPSYARERSTSPRGAPHRPGLARNPPSGEYRTSPSAYYGVPEPATKPIVVTARPKLPREGSRSHSHRTPPNAAYDPAQVRYAATYDTSQVKFADYPGANLYDTARKGDPRDYYQSSRGRAEPMYA